MRLAAFLLVTVTAAWAQLPNIPPDSIVNGAFALNQPIAPGSLISIFGTNLATSLQHADSLPLSKSLGGVSVQFVNGSTTIQAPMLDTVLVNATPPYTQLNLQVPWDIIPPNAPQQTVNVVVTVDGVGSSQPAPVTIGPFSPGIFFNGPDSRGAVQNFSDGTLAQPAGSFPGQTTHPAKAGDILIIYATGLGPVDSPPADGAPAGSQLRSALTPPIVMIGGITAPFISSVLSPQFVGVYQLAVKVPDNAPVGDNVPVQIQLGGITSPASVIMAVSQ